VAARAVLRDMGYVPGQPASPGIEEHSFHGVPLVRHEGGSTFVVELHWQLNNPQFVTIDYTRLWRRILAAGSDRAPLRPLPAEELLLFLSLHLAKHENGVLRLLADVDRLVRREAAALDWPYAVALARHWSVAGLLYFALQRAQALLDTPLPGWVLPHLAPAPWRRALVGLLAGPSAILRPLPDEHLHYNRFRLAYCIMLDPPNRAVAAYRHYLFAPAASRSSGVLLGTVDCARRLARGLAWTGLVLGSALVDRWPSMQRGK
ncbi:MAG: nucleotidyltransferase family protein, partial [Chloroflexi bacterium]|nr:nucleotidyltransferase family protein [Chloroflexota bacterium]